ncbi:unknown [Coprococcus eutactus CAG:665]|nr:unknown [Coprococcus eutactus CAG:665]
MKKLYHSLSKVNALGIKTREQLSQHEDLYAEVFLAIDNFITGIALRSHTNVNRLLELRDLGVDIEDIHYAALERCIKKLDLVLAKDLNQMIPYIYTVVNNKTIDAYRSAIKEHNRVISLDETLDRHDGDDNSKKTKTLEDNLSDKGASAETRLIAKEAVLALFEKYCGNADALLCMIATKVFNDTPREIAEILLSTNSVSKAIALYKDALSSIYRIAPDEFPIVAPIKKTGLSKILSNKDTKAKTVSSKISNIINRVK